MLDKKKQTPGLFLVASNHPFRAASISFSLAPPFPTPPPTALVSSRELKFLFFYFCGAGILGIKITKKSHKDVVLFEQHSSTSDGTEAANMQHHLRQVPELRIGRTRFDATLGSNSQKGALTLVPCHPLLTREVRSPLSGRGRLGKQGWKRSWMLIAASCYPWP